MHRLSIGLRLVSVTMVAASIGCSMCDTAHLCDYAAVGGKWQRSNPTCGRVGSNLSDAGTFQSGRAIESHANFGDSWGIVESEPKPLPAPAEDEFFPMKPESAPPVKPESNSIMIGP